MEPQEKETCNLKKCKISTQLWQKCTFNSYSGDCVELAEFTGITGNSVGLIKS